MTAEEARLDLHALAALLDRSYDYMVRNWRRMCAEEGLPQPFVGRNGRKPRWSRKAVERWRDGESAQPAATLPITAKQSSPGRLDGPASARLDGVRALLKAAGRLS